MPMNKQAEGFGEDEFRALIGARHSAPIDLDGLHRVHDDGIYFEPDPHTWGLTGNEWDWPSRDQMALTPPEGLAERVNGDGAQPRLRVLPFPFAVEQLRAFAEYAMLPALCNWMDLDDDDEGEFETLAKHPRAQELALYLAGRLSFLPHADRRDTAPSSSAARKAVAADMNDKKHARDRAASASIEIEWQRCLQEGMTKDAAAPYIAKRVNLAERTVRDKLKGL